MRVSRERKGFRKGEFKFSQGRFKVFVGKIGFRREGWPFIYGGWEMKWGIKNDVGNLGN